MNERGTRPPPVHPTLMRVRRPRPISTIRPSQLNRETGLISRSGEGSNKKIRRGRRTLWQELSEPRETEKLKPLGKGVTGQVDLINWKAPASGWKTEEDRVRRNIRVAVKNFPFTAENLVKAEREYHAVRLAADFTVFQLELDHEPITLKLEYLPGQSLRSMAEVPVTFRQAAALLVYLLLTLQRFASMGLAHNDISMDNVLVLSPSPEMGSYADCPDEPTFVLIDYAEACGYFFSPVVICPGSDPDHPALQIFTGDTFYQSGEMSSCLPFHDHPDLRGYRLRDLDLDMDGFRDLSNFLLLLREDLTRAADTVFRWYTKLRPPTQQIREHQPLSVISLLLEQPDPPDSSKSACSSSSGENQKIRERSSSFLLSSLKLSSLIFGENGTNVKEKNGWGEGCGVDSACREVFAEVMWRMLSRRCYWAHDALRDLSENPYFADLIEQTDDLIEDRLTLKSLKRINGERVEDTKPLPLSPPPWQEFISNFMPGFEDWRSFSSPHSSGEEGSLP